MILVVGGNSKIGLELVRLLRDRGESVRAVARRQESGDALRALGAEVVEGDLARPDTIGAALAGAERMFLLSSPHHDVVAWQEHAIDAAKRAGVRLLVRSSILGASPTSTMTFARQHGRIDEHLVGSGVPHAILRPNYFAQNVTTVNAPSIGPDGRLFVPVGNARLSMTDTRDVAAVAAAILTGEGHAGRVYDVTGPEPLSHHDVADRLGAAMGRPVEYVDVPLETFRKTMLGYGLQRWLVDGLVSMFEDYQRSGADGYAAQVTDTVERVTGRPARTLDGLLAEWRASMRAGRP